jgi:undecaprenyl-diphosphatase
MNWFRHASLPLLITTTSVTIASFIALSSYISSPVVNDFDLYISNLLFQHKNGAFTLFFTIVTVLFSPVSLSLVTFVMMLHYITRREFFEAHLFVLSMTLGNLSFLSVKLFSHRLRPEIITNQISGFSYPSGHATISTLFFILILGTYSNRIQSFRRRYVFITSCILVIILTGLSRIYLGNHWFTDVVGGYLLGITTLFFVTVNNRIAMWVEKEDWCRVSRDES